MSFLRKAWIIAAVESAKRGYWADAREAATNAVSINPTTKWSTGQVLYTSLEV